MHQEIDDIDILPMHPLLLLYNLIHILNHFYSEH